MNSPSSVEHLTTVSGKYICFKDVRIWSKRELECCLYSETGRSHVSDTPTSSLLTVDDLYQMCSANQKVVQGRL